MKAQSNLCYTGGKNKILQKETTSASE